MSSLKTEQYQLHHWEPGDSVLREEFNENFAKLDVSTRLFFGSYTGDGAAERLISLPITPKAVLLFTRDGKVNIQYGNYRLTYGGMALPGCPVYADNSKIDIALEVTTSGFTAHHSDSSSCRCNKTSIVYHYLALC